MLLSEQQNVYPFVSLFLIFFITIVLTVLTDKTTNVFFVY